MASSAEASMGVSDRPGRVATARGLLITQRIRPKPAGLVVHSLDTAEKPSPSIPRHYPNVTEICA
jgi:hypothetical protein